MRIVSLIHTTQPRTGGQRYNVHLEDCLGEIEGCQVVRIREPFERYPWYMKPVAPLLELKWLFQLHKEDVVLLGDTTWKYHYLLQWLCQGLIHCQTLVMVHHFAYLGTTGMTRYISEHIQDRYLARSNRVLVPSAYTREIAQRKFGDKVVYLPLPFSTTFTCSQSYQAGKLLFVGTIEPRKGLHFLPQMLAALRQDWHLDMVGNVADQRYYKHLRQALMKAGIADRVTFHGRLEEDALETLYQQAEVFVFPSQLEGFGIVLIEAMRYGLPIVAFNNSAIPYTIRHLQNGLLATNPSTAEMAQLLNMLMGNRELRQTLQQGMATTIAELATEKDLRQAIRQLLEQLLEKK